MINSIQKEYAFTSKCELKRLKSWKIFWSCDGWWLGWIIRAGLKGIPHHYGILDWDDGHWDEVQPALTETPSFNLWSLPAWPGRDYNVTETTTTIIMREVGHVRGTTREYSKYRQLYIPVTGHGGDTAINIKWYIIFSFFTI